jgi:multiple sugar transport system permease protein
MATTRLKALSRACQALVFACLLAVNLAPVVWGALTSIKPVKDILAYPPRFFGFAPSLEHYQRIMEAGFLQSMWTSVFNSLACIILCVSLATLAAFGFDRYRFRLRKAAFFMVVLGIPLAIGSSAMLIPNYLYMTKLGITNGRFTLVLIYTAYNLPMSIWIMKGIFESIPKAIDESARLEGCGDLYILFKLLVPLARPAMAAAALFIFIGSWNEFIVATVMVSKLSLRPIQMAIYNFMGYFGLEWGPLSAAATLAIVPILAVFTGLGKMLIAGLTAGSVKS